MTILKWIKRQWQTMMIRMEQATHMVLYSYIDFFRYMKQRIRRRRWERWYNGSPLQMWAESHTKKTADLERRLAQVEEQLDIEPDDEDVDENTKEFLDLLSGKVESEPQDPDFYNLLPDDVVQKEYITTAAAIIKIAATTDNMLHIKICRTQEEIKRIERKDKFGFVISRSQARAFIYEVYKVMKANVEVVQVGFSEFDLTNGIRIAVPDASDLSAFVRILEENKEILAETIQWKNDNN